MMTDKDPNYAANAKKWSKVRVRLMALINRHDKSASMVERAVLEREIEKVRIEEAKAWNAYMGG